MAAPAIVLPRYCVDTNVLIDLGEGKIFAQRFLAKFRSHGLAAPPTVIQELTYIATQETHPACKHAMEVLINLRRWEIKTYDLMSAGHGITGVNAEKLISSGLLPEGEFQDGLILIETALHCIPVLITSDIHLLGINPAKLANKLEEFDLRPVSIFHPMAMLP